jgi:hypothetical protein
MMLTEQEQKILDNAPIEIEFDNALNEAGWALSNELSKYGDINGNMFNNMKGCLKIAIEAYLADLRKKQEPIKPRMKVEYVRVVDSIFDLKDDLLAGNLYWKDSDGSFKVLIKRAVVSMKDDIKFAAAFMGDNLYRKVETEIKTEKQKIINELTDEFNNWISSDEDFAIHLTSKFNITKK